MPSQFSLSDPEKPLLLVVAGPTASGKTGLTLALAALLPAEIVNCDSMQMVRGLEIGTAKPTPRERARAPHHLFDIVGPEEHYSAGRYMVEARAVCRQIAQRDRIPIVVGGTGLYLRALLEGIFAGPGRVEGLRQRLSRMADRWGSERLHRRLAAFDPAAARSIQPRDRLRVIRALEVYFASGDPLSSQRSRRRPLEGFRVIRLGLSPPRAELYLRIDRRVEEMYSTGLVEEVQGLLEAGLSPECKGFEAIGYRHVIRLLKGESDLATARQLTARDTRRYAKRQLTWFRKEPEMKWIDTFGDDPQALQEALAHIGFLGNQPAGG